MNYDDLLHLSQEKRDSLYEQLIEEKFSERLEDMEEMLNETQSVDEVANEFGIESQHAKYIASYLAANPHKADIPTEARVAIFESVNLFAQAEVESEWWA